MDDRGNIREYSEQKHKELMLQRKLEAEKGLRHRVTPITKDEAAFFRSKGTAFRQLWGSRLAKGLSREQRETLNQMVNEFVRSQ